jgi:hypothetical protein
MPAASSVPRVTTPKGRPESVILNPEKKCDFLRERPRRSSGLHRGMRATEGPSLRRAGAGSAHRTSPVVLLARSFGRRAGLSKKANSPRRLPQEVTHSIFGFGIKKDHRGFCCTPRITGNGGELATRNTVSRTSAVGAARQASLGTSGTADGWTRGRGPSAFFQAPHCRQQRPAACHPASPDARSREPSLRTTAAGTRLPSRVPRIHKIAHQVFVKAGSGALPAGLFAGGCWG